MKLTFALDVELNNNSYIPEGTQVKALNQLNQEGKFIDVLITQYNTLNGKTVQCDPFIESFYIDTFNELK